MWIERACWFVGVVALIGGVSFVVTACPGSSAGEGEGEGESEGEGEGEGEGTPDEQCVAALDAYVAASVADGCDAVTVCRLELMRDACTGSFIEQRVELLGCLEAETCLVPSDPTASDCAGGTLDTDDGARIELAGRLCACQADLPWPNCPDDSAAGRAEVAAMSDAAVGEVLACVDASPNQGSCGELAACVDASTYIDAVIACGS